MQVARTSKNGLEICSKLESSEHAIFFHIINGGIKHITNQLDQESVDKDRVP